MKRTLIIFAGLLFFAPVVLAATIVSDHSTNLDQYEVKTMAPVMITSTSDGDITAEHGIQILIDKDDKILFDKRTLSFIGSAINNGRVNLNVQAVFSEDYKSVFIPVMKDFQAGDWLQVSGLALRAYDDDTVPRYMGLDLNGDFIAEVSDINKYEVGTSVNNDHTSPYPVNNAVYVINIDGSVTLTWNIPPDYDYYSTIINRTRVKSGNQSSLSTVYDGFGTTFTDVDLTDVTSVSYSIVARDTKGNWSDPVVLEIDLTAPVEESAQPAEEPVAPESEAEELSRLLNYYNVRYSIKCMPSGVVVAENNSACLWARIDLIYAQGVTGEEKVAGLALSDRDLELMTSRRKWPEKRYEDNCTLAEEPATYCPALGKALDRISYFLD